MTLTLHAQTLQEILIALAKLGILAMVLRVLMMMNAHLMQIIVILMQLAQTIQEVLLVHAMLGFQAMALPARMRMSVHLIQTNAILMQLA